MSEYHDGVSRVHPARGKDGGFRPYEATRDTIIRPVQRSAICGYKLLVASCAHRFRVERANCDDQYQELVDNADEPQKVAAQQSRTVRRTRPRWTSIPSCTMTRLAIGIAFGDITENFLASIFLSMQRPFETGDLVEISHVTGFVQQLNVLVRRS